jgi:hypothetical protein
MTLDELEKLIADAAWFQRLAAPDIGDECIGNRYVRIASLAPWANQPTNNAELMRIADAMSWLPSSRDQSDPIHGQLLVEKATSLDKQSEFARRAIATQKSTLVALRSFGGHPALRVGPHDFTEAARSAAVFAAKQAAYEALLDEPGFWCGLMRLYHAGRWPCGLLSDGRVVVL